MSQISNATTLHLQSLIQLRDSARLIQLEAGQLTRSTQLGGYRSAYRGRGLEFDEVRPYQEGDDIRSIDWRVTARRGKPHTKLFREERERPILLLIDLHPGMHFGSTTQLKSVLAGRLCALLGWAAIHAGDRVGGIVTSALGEQVIPPTSRENALLQLLSAMVALQPRQVAAPVEGESDHAVERLAHLARPGTLVVLLSDFRQISPAADPALQALSLHNDLIFGFLYDPLEQTPPPQGAYPVSSQQRSWILHSEDRQLQQRWQQYFAQHREETRKRCHNSRGHWMEISTADPLPHTLQLGLQQRQHPR